jgi:hypothetical protein
MESVELLERFGTTVKYVHGMPDHGCYVSSQNVALIRQGLTGAELEAAAAQLLAAVLQQLSAGRRR